MQDPHLLEYKFKSIYEFVSIVYDAVEGDFDFWNFNGDLFVQSALKFNKNSLLHIYASSTLYCYFRRDFRKNGDCKEYDDIEWWIDLMAEYGLELTEDGYDEDADESSWNWFQKNEELFMEFFDVISAEIVHVLFNDKQFLVKFNRLVRNVIIDKNGSYSGIVAWPDGARNDDGTIKRCSIPQWVKQAVYHRDKGHCVYCNKDLTGIVNLLNVKNFDHIIPLKEYGTNDPCNIQLTCEQCNKSKGGKETETVYKYQSWW